VHRGLKCAFAHRIDAHDIDAQLETDEIGIRVGDGTGDKVVDLALAVEAKMQKLEPDPVRGDCWPAFRRTARLHAMADGAAVMHPQFARFPRFAYAGALGDRKTGQAHDGGVR